MGDIGQLSGMKVACFGVHARQKRAKSLDFSAHAALDIQAKMKNGGGIISRHGYQS